MTDIVNLLKNLIFYIDINLFFRKINAVCQVIADAVKALEEDKHFFLCDLMKGFDCVSRKLLLEKLTVDKRICNFLFYYPHKSELTYIYIIQNIPVYLNY